MIAVPTLTDVLLMHELMLATFGGMRGITEQGFGKLEAALATPHQSMFGEDLYPDLPSKATALFYGLIRAHGLSDGNKRVALVAVLDMLARNGYTLVTNDDELFAFTIAAAEDLDRTAINLWLTNHLAPL